MSDDITHLLNAAEAGDLQAAEDLLPLVYGELRKLAAARFRRLPPGQTLQPTALVHEAWERILRSGPAEWNGRGHFFAAAAEAMRRILVDRARRKAAIRHGGGLRRIDLANVDVASEADSDVVLAIHEALNEFAAKDPTGAELIKLRFFAGLPNHEAAEVLGISERTAKRTWAYARTWLYQALRDRGDGA